MSYFLNRYPLRSKIISGGNGDIYSTPTRINDRELVVKIAKWDKTLSHVPREIVNNIRLQRLRGINKMLDFHYTCEPLPETLGTYYMVFERKPTDLFDFLVKHEPEENKCKDILRNILDILYNMQSRVGLIQMDLKEENILVDPHTMEIELCDMGFCVQTSQEWVECSNEGTMAYLAPECLKGKCYPMKSIVWTFGILTYSTLLGDVPWKSYKPGLSFESKSNFNLLSDDAKDFIKYCLEPDHTKRPTLHELCEHQWLKNTI